MKKCPICQKEFPDTMRFCQTDGTPLLDAAPEATPEDPLKTTVVRQEDIASSIPSSDPFKTVVAGSETKDESGDLLQLPEEFDPMKTMVVAPLGQDKPAAEPPKFEEIKEEIKAETPSSPFGAFSQPSEPLPEPVPDISNDPTVFQPDPPKFNEPEVAPPSFGAAPPNDPVEDDLPATMIQNSWDAGTPPSDSSPFSGSSPFSKPADTPVSSPFDAPKPSFDPPPASDQQSPFGAPSSPFDAPKSPFDTPQGSPFGQPQQSSYDQPMSFDPPKPTYQEPVNQFGGQQFDQMNQMNDPAYGGQPLQQNDWTPPPTPVAGWQDQGLGQQTPFQPPVAMQGQNQTLPIISLVFGILSVCCYVGWITGPVALITGYLGMKNANSDPTQYGGKGLATAGMIVGGIFTAIWVIYWIIYILVIVGLIASGGIR
ncbi:MAG: DUF4190 domain-containing protein [Acidobacteria bacterium]|nr:DUF4190 domain-containing protein [Acidobacteriota bacterium]